MDTLSFSIGFWAGAGMLALAWLLVKWTARKTSTPRSSRSETACTCDLKELPLERLNRMTYTAHLPECAFRQWVEG